ncbi:hypothetical protein [Bremerella sp. P1]|uniref:hypothetical protein n=1 Tax=Bremerella sp. P1 TaxID=3026424 RepID=UPI0023684BE6|nr:hypothetical protein [Bremerella sp. P1]WDI44130.1 hypothetical protein PSR63_09310 [Bremerella sp. P1]
MSDANERSEGNTPQVIVRAGKTFLCTACGTLVEIPADVVGQLVLVGDHAPQADDSEEKPTTPDPPASHESNDQPESLPAPASQPHRAEPVRLNDPPPRPKRPRQPKRDSFVHQMIDGLRVPSSNELDRAFTWVSFHLKVLDRQGSEIKRLKKRLKQHATSTVPSPSRLRRANEVTRPEPVGAIVGVTQSHAQAELGVPLVSDTEHPRGPP